MLIKNIFPSVLKSIRIIDFIEASIQLNHEESLLAISNKCKMYYKCNWIQRLI